VFYNDVNFIQFSCKNELPFKKFQWRHTQIACCFQNHTIIFIVRNVCQKFVPGSKSVAYPGILFGGGGSSTNSFEDKGQRERKSGGGSPLVRGSEGSCNLVKGMTFHIVKFS